MSERKELAALKAGLISLSQCMSIESARIEGEETGFRWGILFGALFASLAWWLFA